MPAFPSQSPLPLSYWGCLASQPHTIVTTGGRSRVSPPLSLPCRVPFRWWVSCIPSPFPGYYTVSPSGGGCLASPPPSLVTILCPLQVVGVLCPLPLPWLLCRVPFRWWVSCVPSPLLYCPFQVMGVLHPLPWLPYCVPFRW